MDAARRVAEVVSGSLRRDANDGCLSHMGSEIQAPGVALRGQSFS
jgi:hypothetical protein